MTQQAYHIEIKSYWRPCIIPIYYVKMTWCLQYCMLLPFCRCYCLVDVARYRFRRHVLLSRIDIGTTSFRSNVLAGNSRAIKSRVYVFFHLTDAFLSLHSSKFMIGFWDNQEIISVSKEVLMKGHIEYFHAEIILELSPEPIQRANKLK